MKRMKIDFRERVQISSHFADWLENILEPAVEDRLLRQNMLLYP